MLLFFGGEKISAVVLPFAFRSQRQVQVDNIYINFTGEW